MIHTLIQILILNIALFAAKAQADTFEDLACRAPAVDSTPASDILAAFETSYVVRTLPTGADEVLGCQTLKLSSDGNFAIVQRNIRVSDKPAFQLYLVSGVSQTARQILSQSYIEYVDQVCGGRFGQSCFNQTQTTTVELISVNLKKVDNLEKFVLAYRGQITGIANTNSGRNPGTHIASSSLNFCGHPGVATGSPNEDLNLTDRNCVEYSAEARVKFFGDDFLVDDRLLPAGRGTNFPRQDEVLPSAAIGSFAFSQVIESVDSIFIKNVDVSNKYTCSELTRERIEADVASKKLVGFDDLFFKFQTASGAYLMDQPNLGGLATGVLSRLESGIEDRPGFRKFGPEEFYIDANGKGFLVVGTENCLNL